MASWFPLPFPQCASCDRAWVRCRHRGCAVDGELEVEPWQEHVRCLGCGATWRLRESTFFCTCTNQFAAAQVEDAVDEVVFATKQVYSELRRREEELRVVAARSDASFEVWMTQIAATIGGAAGYLVGTLIRVLRG
jgi:hypothetical protein